MACSPNWKRHPLAVAPGTADDEEPFATLLKAEDLYAKLSETTARRGPRPADWAFIVMCHHKLGHADESRAALARCREIMLLDTFKDDEECNAFLHEAEALIEGKPGGGD